MQIERIQLADADLIVNIVVHDLILIVRVLPQAISYRFYFLSLKVITQIE